MRVLRLLVLLVVGASPAAAQDEDLNPAQRRALRAVIERLRKESGRLSATRAATYEFEEFTTHELAHAVEGVELPRELRGALDRLYRTVVHRRGAAGKLERATDICFLLGSADEADWRRARDLLRREPVGQAVERAVVALRDDPRPEIRLVAIRLATTLVAFGHDSEGLRATVLQGLADPHPNVAAQSALGAEATHDKRVIDRMVAGLDDPRTIVRRASPLLKVDARRVNEVFEHWLNGIIWSESLGKWPMRLPPPGQRPAYPGRVERSPDEIRAWWKKNRAAFGFCRPAPMWRPVFDDVLVLARNRPVIVRLAEGTPLRIVLKRYEEGWDGGAPIAWIDAEMTDVRLPRDEHDVGSLTNMGTAAWATPQGRTSWTIPGPAGRVLNGSLAWKAVFLPTHQSGHARVRLMIHLEHDK